MQFILHLIQKYKNFLLFFVLELIALLLTIQLHSYQRSKFINSSGAVTGGIYNNFVSLESFVHLTSENKRLNQENSDLYNELEALKKSQIIQPIIDSLHETKFQYKAATIINNDYHRKNNFITLDVGKNNGVHSDMAVVNNLGIVGITTKSSNNYSVAISVLNKYFKTNAKFKNSDYFGTISWNGDKINVVQLYDIPRQAVVAVGDTIVTGGRSSIFPQGILIGRVKDVEYHNQRHHKINVELFNDLRKINSVQIIENKQRLEIINLENQSHE